MSFIYIINLIVLVVGRAMLYPCFKLYLGYMYFAVFYNRFEHGV